MPLEQRIVPAEVIQAIIAAAPSSETQTMLMFMRETGFRASEVVSLTWGDVFYLGERCVVSINGKGGRWRTVPITDAMFERLRALRRDRIWPENERVFPFTRQTLHKKVKAAVRRAAVENPHFSAHWFRHAFVSHLLDAGVEVHEVRELAGHASLETTTRYAHAKKLPCPGDVLRGM